VRLLIPTLVCALELSVQHPGPLDRPPRVEHYRGRVGRLLVVDHIPQELWLTETDGHPNHLRFDVRVPPDGYRPVVPGPFLSSVVLPPGTEVRVGVCRHGTTPVVEAVAYRVGPLLSSPRFEAEAHGYLLWFFRRYFDLTSRQGEDWWAYLAVARMVASQNLDRHESRTLWVRDTLAAMNYFALDRRLHDVISRWGRPEFLDRANDIRDLLKRYPAAVAVIGGIPAMPTQQYDVSPVSTLLPVEIYLDSAGGLPQRVFGPGH
jgi:hypothetical protein